jgi:hypothetical protein
MGVNIRDCPSFRNLPQPSVSFRKLREAPGEREQKVEGLVVGFQGLKN